MRAATSAKAVASAVLSEPVIDAVRKELRRQTGHLADKDRIAETLRAEVIRPELV
jgi:hypothetical protein